MTSPKASVRNAVTKASILTPTNLEELQWDLQETQLAIARRAYELFEARGCEHGHDWEDWFRAETELVRPVSYITSEKEDCLSVRANVLGFEETELKAGVEPHRLIILGKKELATNLPEQPTTKPGEWTPDQVLQIIELPTEIDPSGVVIELKTGVLSFELPKIAVKQLLGQAHAA